MRNRIMIVPILYGEETNSRHRAEAEELGKRLDLLLCTGWQIKETRLIEYKDTVFAHYVLEPYVTYTTDKEDKVVSTKQVEQEEVRSDEH